MESWLKLSVFEISWFYNYYDGYIRERTNERVVRDPSGMIMT